MVLQNFDKKLLVVMPDHKCANKRRFDGKCRAECVFTCGKSGCVVRSFADPILSEQKGYVRFEDIIPGSTCRGNGWGNWYCWKSELGICKSKKATTSLYFWWIGQTQLVMICTFCQLAHCFFGWHGQAIHAGDMIAKIPKGAAKTSDITAV